jgi:hypothetical protein
VLRRWSFAMVRQEEVEHPPHWRLAHAGQSAGTLSEMRSSADVVDVETDAGLAINRSNKWSSKCGVWTRRRAASCPRKSTNTRRAWLRSRMTTRRSRRRKSAKASLATVTTWRCVAYSYSLSTWTKGAQEAETLLFFFLCRCRRPIIATA